MNSALTNNLPLPVISIMGPTASGKTAAALRIAQEIPCEIISVDSALVYRGMDIGSAKPSAFERSQVRHHLIDIIDPEEAYSVAQFLHDSAQLVTDIRARGNTPLLVGGTMMYFKALMDGIDDLPPADPEVRLMLDEKLQSIGLSGLYQLLAETDPDTAARLKPQDSQRILRALEIAQITGSSMSQLLAQSSRRPAAFSCLSISLEPFDRAALHTRIEQRFDSMLEQGFLDEVRNLRLRPELHADLPSMRCVGYRQAWEHLDGLYTYAAMRERGIIATRQLAKRQLTWCRSIPERTIFDCMNPDYQQSILDFLHQQDALR